MIPQNAPVSRWLGRGWILLFCLLLAGCSSKGTVSGRITYQGKPIPQGTVLFVPEKGQSVTGIITDGQYQVKGIVSGVAKIAVQPAEVKAPKGFGGGAPKKMMGGPPKDAPLPPGIDPSIFDFNAQISKVQSTSIPDKYKDPEKSGLTCTVKGGAQEHNIELK